MKKNSPQIGICFLLPCLILALSGCAQQKIKNIDSSGKTIVCFGDSLTFGYGVERGEDYPSVLGKKVSLPVVNSGVSSQTSVQGLGRVDRDVLAHEPAIVIVEFGGNDFLNQVPKEKTREAICTIIDKIHQAKAMVVLLDISAGFLFQEYQPFLRSIANQKEALFIPNVFFNVVNNPSLKSDFVHPNAQGYALVAERIFNTLNPYLAQRAAGISKAAPAKP